MKYLFKACRPKQWTKNLIVFGAPFFAFSQEFSIWFPTFISFISFCLISSSVYLLNDCIDKNFDSKHPIKKKRPIASGKISIKIALSFSLILLTSSLIIPILLNINLLLILSLYVLIQIFYCLKLKSEPIFDIFCIGSGFLLRAIAGGSAANLNFSPWFLLSVGLLALFLAIEKRKAELKNSIKFKIQTRKSLEKYSLPLLKRFESIVSTSTFICYSLWAIGTPVNGASNNLMILTIPFVLLGIFRYQLITDSKERNRGEITNDDISPESPEEILINDKVIAFVLIGWVLTILIIGYFAN